MSSPPDKPDTPSNPSPGDQRGKLRRTLSSPQAIRVADLGREELASSRLPASTPAAVRTSEPPSPTKSDPPLGKTQVKEVSEAAVRLTDGVDVITDTLILILGKFRSIIWRTNIGMIFGGTVLVICIVVAHQTWNTSKIQEANTKRIEELTGELETLQTKLTKIQQSANTTQQTVEAVKQSNENKPSIEIVPDKNRPGSAKVVIRPAPTDSASTASAPPVVVKSGLPPHISSPKSEPSSDSNLVEIPITIPKD